MEGQQSPLSGVDSPCATVQCLLQRSMQLMHTSTDPDYIERNQAPKLVHSAAVSDAR